MDPPTLGRSLRFFKLSGATGIVKGVSKKSDHIPTPAFPLTPDHLKIICDFVDKYGINGLPVKAAILLGYTCFLRSSNLVSPSSLLEGPHTLKAADIQLAGLKLNVIIRSSKTIANSAPVILEVKSVSNTHMCPVYNWSRYVAHFKPQASRPAFILMSGCPLTPRPIVYIMRLALRKVGMPQYKSVSMHSLRRGGTQAAEDHWASDEQLKLHGTWRSDKGLQAYKKSSTMVPRLLAKSLAF